MASAASTAPCAPSARPTARSSTVGSAPAAIGAAITPRCPRARRRSFRECIAGRQGARPGLQRLLERARRAGIRTAVATSSTEANTRFLLRQMGLGRLFDAAVWYRDGLRSKPHPDFFLEAARRLGVAPGRCVVFEDSVHGFWAARRAGMGLVAIAESGDDLPRCRMWTPWVARDFRPAEQFFSKRCDFCD